MIRCSRAPSRSRGAACSRALPRPGDDASRKAAEALAIATRSEAALVVLGQLMAAQASEMPGTTYTDPVVARIQARRRRIAESGLRLVSGDGAS
jgi:hypothetical protein